MSTPHFLQSKIFRNVLIGLGVTTIALFIFRAGMLVGSHKALFGCKWGENYSRNFGGEHGRRGRQEWFRPGEGRPEMSGHGVLGAVVSVNATTIVVRGRDDIERDVEVGDTTAIKHENDTLKISDIKVGDNVMAFGAPDDSGRITATLVRVLGVWPLMPR